MIAPLEEAGLSGAFSVHHAPRLGALDRCAHQVLFGFHWGEIVLRLSSFFAPETEVIADGARMTLKDVPAATQVLVIPAQAAENPGGLNGLVWLMDRLLGPGGCPWDQAQTHSSLVRCLLEESYELAEAIETGNEPSFLEELGDVLLQPIMHGQMRARDGGWDAHFIADRVTKKLIHRHPHVFGESTAQDEAAVLRQWDAIKRAEKGVETSGLLDGVPKGLPALMAAMEISKRAARVGFEWPDAEGVWQKFREEEAEFREAWAAGDKEAMEAEMGDLLFTLVNLARWAKCDPEQALRRMLTRFIERFRAMEALAGRPLDQLNSQEWDELWNAAKAQTRSSA